MKYLLLLICSLFGLSACQEKAGKPEVIDRTASRAQRILDSALVKHGSRQLQQAELRFQFRERAYYMDREGGRYRYERRFSDSTGASVTDVLTNEGFTRLVDGDTVELSEKKAAAYANAVNSVFYFALLPYFLTDEAVQLSYLGQSTLEDQPYEKLRVTFREEGGGKDHEDEYVYWIHQDRHTMDYLAYNYEVDGGGARFRKAYNVRYINGVRFADYINMKPVPETIEVATFDQLYKQNKLKELSRIKTENIELQLKNQVKVEQ